MIGVAFASPRPSDIAALVVEALQPGACRLDSSSPPPDLQAVVLVVLPSGPPRSLIDLDEAAWRQGCLGPLDEMASVIRRAQGLFGDRRGHVILVIAESDLTGSAGFVAQATVVEGLRALAKSAAAGWRFSGPDVTTIVVDSDRLTDDGSSLGADLADLLRSLCHERSGMTGATIALGGTHPILT